MLTDGQLLAWFQRFNVSDAARSVINHVRSQNPARRVGGGRSNVSGRYPSRKMGATIQFESHRVELAGIYEMEHHRGVLEYFDQPPTLKFNYESPAGKQMGVLHTPDFFVIRDSEAGWEEWKTEEELKRLQERNRNRYMIGDGGRWRCPPGIAYAERLGLYYRVRSSAEIDWVFQRNVLFLEDYLRAGSQHVSPAARDTVLAHVTAAPGLLLSDLMQLVNGRAQPDEVFGMIASDALHVDWHAAPLAEPNRVRVFATPGSAAVMNDETKLGPGGAVTSIRCGSQVSWDGRAWTVVNVGDTAVSLLAPDQSMADVPMRAFETLFREQRLKVVSSNAGPPSESASRDRLALASEADLQVATHRAGLIRQYLNAATRPVTDVPNRTFFRWLRQYREADSAYGNGFLGLLPRSSKRGNRAAKLPDASLRLMREHIERDYETVKQQTRYASWIKLHSLCESQATPTPSYKSFCLAVKRRPIFDQTLKRQGHRAAYQVAPFYWTLDLTTPRHGDRPFEIVHLDHTELDVECATASGQQLGRPWMTLLTDAFSRRTLAFYVTFDPPSYRSCMMVLRECVRRSGRFPQSLVVDGGPEFQSTYFETLLARYECTKKTRPPSKARFGSILERMFGVANTQFVHNLRGNTQATRNVRQVTKTVDPKNLATWPLAELHARLAEYLYDVHDGLDHQGLGQSPREAFQAGLASGGARLQRMIAYDQEFLMLTLPTTPKGTARVTPSAGIKIHHIYYWCEAFRQIAGESVPVRYDPFDAGIAYAFVHKQWVQCHSDCYGTLKGRSEREIMLATAELRRRRQNRAVGFYVTARRLAEFLESVEAEEALLSQRLRDGESRAIRPETAGRSGEDVSTKQPEAVEKVATLPMPLHDEAVGDQYGVF